MVGNTSIMEKLNKLALIYLSQSNVIVETSSKTSSKNLLIEQEDFICEASKKLELIKHHRIKSKVVKTADGNVRNLDAWVVAKSWNSCPIGMLPRDLGSSGRLPVLDFDDNKHGGDYQKRNKPQLSSLYPHSDRQCQSCGIKKPHRGDLRTHQAHSILPVRNLGNAHM